jgi:hypothetical protein
MKQLSITGWNIHGVLQKSSGAKINKIDDNDFKTHMASDILLKSQSSLLICTFKSPINIMSPFRFYLTISSSSLANTCLVFIKRNILPGISLIDKTLSELMWFKLNANFFGFVRDLYVCFIYIAM